MPVSLSCRPSAVGQAARAAHAAAYYLDLRPIRSLAFGLVEVGTSASLTIRMKNSGTDTVTITRMTSPVGFRVDWSGGPLPAGSGADLTVTFAPEDVRAYSGLLIVSGDLTGGENRIGVSGNGHSPPPAQ